MNIFTKVNDLQALLNAKPPNSTIGFVPTMGALHSGHISLLKKAVKENDLVVLSVFVNPSQFNDPEDLINYPRTLKEDILLLEPFSDVVLFVPSVQEVYPNGLMEQFSLSLSPLDEVMEGAFRPGHFKGVATVVKRLFEIVQPQRAYFGQKDFQQLAIIKYMVGKLGLNIEIIGCPTVREENGLAMSSRNVNLSSEAREKATIIPKVLMEAKKLSEFNSVQEVKGWVRKQIEGSNFLKLDYFEISDANTLSALENWNGQGNNVACIAVFAGKVRLIDNTVF